MSTPLPLDWVAVGIHAMPCANRCRHCWAEGSPRHALVPREQVTSVLDHVAALREEVPGVFFFLYDEPTLHPHFVEILEHAAALGLTGDRFFLPTNGRGLAGAEAETWERLKASGVGCLQLTAYGLENTHDAFAGRRGAFRDLVQTIAQANVHGVSWYLGIVLHADNIDELPAAIDYFRALDPDGQARVGWHLFLWQGRGRAAPRVRADGYMRLPVRLRRRDDIVMEAEARRRILGDPQLAERRLARCGGLTLHVERDLRVYCGGACDTGGIAGVVPELRGEFTMGTLDERGLFPFVRAYVECPPRGVALLGEITWGELAERYGNAAGDEMYYLEDLPNNKWAATYLLDCLQSGVR